EHGQGAEADRGVVHAAAADAAGGHHGGHAVAAGLDHLAALLVAGGAGHDTSVLGHVALAHAHGQVAAADHHAVHHAAERAHAALEHHAQILHHAAGHRVVAGAGDLHAPAHFLHLHGAPRHHEHVGHHRGGRPAHRRRRHAR